MSRAAIGFFIIVPIVLIVILLALQPWKSPVIPDPNQAIKDLRGCERRVGIPSPLDPAYRAIREHRYGIYVKCMVDLGYRSKDMP
jgi:hypothetical protein